MVYHVLYSFLFPCQVVTNPKHAVVLFWAMAYERISSLLYWLHTELLGISWIYENSSCALGTWRLTL